jgi:hypothetical protein
MRLVYRLGILLALVICSYVLVSIGLIATGDSSDYLAAIIDKHRLLDTTPSPRIILVGGSNVAYGVDSELIQRQIGLPVVNMGLHASFGLHYMLNEVEPSLRAGDIVLVIPEYEQFYGSPNGNDTLDDMLFLFPDGIRYLNTRDQMITAAMELPSSIQWQVDRRLARLLFPEEPSTYNRNSFNARGDMVGHLGKPTQINLVRNPTPTAVPQPFEDQSLTVLNQFYDYAKTRGAEVALMFPPVPDIQYENEKTQIQRLYDWLTDGLGFTIISQPGNYAFPIDYFFDSAYHLNAQGRQVRTAQMIKDMQKGLALTNIPEGAAKPAQSK